MSALREPDATVLIVDDDIGIRRMMGRVLSSTYRVVEAEGVDQALAMVARHSVDLVLMDVVMTGSDGFEGCRRIKAGVKEYLPVLLLSGVAAPDARRTGFEAGADDFLLKPIVPRDLELKLAAFIKLRRQELVLQEELRELRKLVALKDDLVDLLVHDLRSPLTAVTCAFRMLEERVTEPELQEDVRIGIAATERVTALAEDLLSVRMLESGALRPEFVVGSPLEVVETAVESMQLLAAESGVRLVVSGSPDIRARFDRKLLVRAVENLVGNAVRYTHEVVELSVTAEDEGVTIVVADRGPGIPAAFKPRLFEKFGSIEARSGGVRRGVGLGLYMVRMAAHAHGGSVSVEDRDGGGALFRLRLPLTVR